MGTALAASAGWASLAACGVANQGSSAQQAMPSAPVELEYWQVEKG